MAKPIIKELRKNKGLTQKEMAEYFKIPLSSYTNYENGYRQIPYELLTEFENFFGVGISLLLNIEGDHNPVKKEIALGYVKFFSNLASMNEIEKEEALRIYDSLFDFLNAITKDNTVRFRNRDVDRLLFALSRMNENGLKSLIETAAVLSLDKD